MSIPNPIAAYKLADANDSFNGFHLTNSGVSFATDGISGKGGTFGSGTYLYRADAADALRLGGDFSVSVWFKPTNHAAVYMIVSKDDNVTRGYQLYYNTSQKIVWAHPNPSLEAATSAASASDSVWNHVVVDWAQSTKKLGIRVNGGTREEFTFASAMTASTAELEVGREAYPGFPFPFEGMIDELYIWNQTLSAAAGLELYSSGAGVFYPFPSATGVIVYGE